MLSKVFCKTCGVILLNQFNELTEEEVKKIDSIVESFDVAGARYPPGVPIST